MNEDYEVWVTMDVTSNYDVEPSYDPPRYVYFGLNLDAAGVREFLEKIPGTYHIVQVESRVK